MGVVEMLTDLTLRRLSRFRWKGVCFDYFPPGKCDALLWEEDLVA